MNHELYGNLARSLAPGLREIAILDAAGAPLWSSGGPARPLPTALLARAPALGGRAAEAKALGDGQSLLPVTAGERLLGWVYLQHDAGTTHAEISQRLSPCLAVLADALMASGAPTEALDRTLEGLAGDLEASGSYLYAPTVGRRHRWTVHAHALEGAAARLDRLAEHLWPVLRGDPVPVLMNRIRLDASAELEPFRIACVPVRHRDAVLGLAFVWRTSDAKRFEPGDLHRLETRAPALGLELADAFDPGTGLLTRGAFESRLVGVRVSARARARCLVYADVDRFHVVNDAVGFALGDVVLRRVAEQLLASELPPDSFVGRLSGDRFIACLEDTSLNGARVWAERLQARLATMHVGDVDFSLTVSFGTATLAAEDDVAQTLANAETACRAAKDRGRGRIEMYTSADASMIQRRVDVRRSEQVRVALDQGTFELHAQPIVRLSEPAAAPECELLIRMKAPDGSLVSPDDFLSAATRYQLLKRLDAWVLESVERQLELHGAGIAGVGLRFWINVSGQSLHDAEFAEQARRVVKRCPVPAGTLNFEITENAAIGNLAHARRLIARLRDVGSSVKLDDFGTGLCSLAYLRELNVSGVKIDGGFVRELGEDPRVSPVLSGILHIARQAGLETTAECVETDVLAERVRSLGIDYGQGYAMGRPEPVGDLLHRLALRRTAA